MTASSIRTNLGRGRSLGLLLSAFIAGGAAAQTLQVQPVTISGGTTIYLESTTLRDIKLSTTVQNQTLRVESAQSVPAPVKSGPVCGGAGQATCANKPATFEAAAVGKCPQGTFFDLGTWQCWSCPAGYTRTAESINGQRACSRRDTSIKGEFTKAAFQGAVCPAGSFYDPIRGGECWSCPNGYKRSLAHIDAANACFIPGGEAFRAINRHSRATGVFKTDCPRGQFWDAIDGYCYSCPGGFNRTGYSVRDAKACSAHVKEQHAKASVVKKAECRAGEIRDMKVPGGSSDLRQLAVEAGKNGGGCWTCPDTYARTVLPIDGGSACERGGGVAFKNASAGTPLTCPAGQVFDFIGLTAADISARKLSNVKPVASGTCWSCPTGYDRTLASVKSQDACNTKTMGWFSAPYDEPGLFGLAGADAVLREVAKDRPAFVSEAIQKVAEESAKTSRKPLATVLANEKKLFATAPHQSTAAAGIVLARMLAAIAEPGKASAAEKKLVSSFSAYVTAKRTWIAQDALDAYDAWKAADTYQRNQRKNTNMMQLIDYGTVPPDFSTLATMNAMAVTAGSTTIGIAAGSLPLIGDVLGIALGAAAGGFADFTDIDTAGRFAARTAVETAVAKAIELALTNFAKTTATKVTSQLSSYVGATLAKQVAARTLSVAGSAGPQIIIAASLMVGQMALEQVIDIQNARPKLLTALAGAKRAPELQRMAQTAEGIGEIMGLWSFATAGDAAPQSAFLSAFTPLANAAISSPAPTAAAAAKPVAPTVAAARGAPVAAASKAAPKADGPEGFLIMNPSANRMCLGVRGSRPAPNAQLEIERCRKGAPDQTWTQDEKTGQLMVDARSASLCMEIVGANPADGADLRLLPCAPKPNQAWELTPDGHIRSRMHGKCVDLDTKGGARGKARPGTDIHVMGCGKTPSQIWTGG